MSTKVDSTYDLNKLKVEAVGGMSTKVDLALGSDIERLKL